MSLFFDTCAFIALINYDDDFHSVASDLFTKAAHADEKFFTSNYVILETVFLLQRELGLSAVNDFRKLLLPIINVIWVDEKIHNNSLSNLVSAQKRKISLTDYTSFHIIDGYKIDTVFTFDKHFKERDFKILE